MRLIPSSSRVPRVTEFDGRRAHPALRRGCLLSAPAIGRNNWRSRGVHPLRVAVSHDAARAYARPWITSAVEES